MKTIDTKNKRKIKHSLLPEIHDQFLEKLLNVCHSLIGQQYKIIKSCIETHEFLLMALFTSHNLSLPNDHESQLNAFM